MQARDFLLVNAAIIALIIYKLISGRRQQKPTPLEMTSYKPKARTKMEDIDDSAPSTSSDERPLNCYFNFNAMTFDAFEVLGVPSGADKEACYRAYVDLKRKTPTAPIVDQAWEALQKYF